MEQEKKYSEIFKTEVLRELFPGENADRFFELLYGDADEGAYDIEIAFEGYRPGVLEFSFNLKRRPGKCLACNLTYGLPHVFSRHPALDVKGMVEKIGARLNEGAKAGQWRLGSTREISSELHVIPLEISIEERRAASA